MSAQRIIISLYFLVFAGTLAMSGFMYMQMSAEYKQLQEVQERSAKKLSELEYKLKEQQVMLDRLRHDPAYVERVIRRQLKYAKPEEYVYRFEN